MPKGPINQARHATLSSWCESEEICTVCETGAGYFASFSDEQMILCDQCSQRGIHIKCYKSTIADITERDLESPAFQWFCSQECQSISHKIRDQANKRMKLSGTTEFTYEIVRYSTQYRPTQQTINTAISIFHSAFGPTKYSDGTDLVEVVCKGQADAGTKKEDGDEEVEEIPDCSGFFVLVLRKGGVIVSAATIRVQGPVFAEIPYVATKDGYRREGNCRRLMTAVETFLHDLGVEIIVMPAVDKIAGMWIKKFGFQKAGRKTEEAVESRVLLPGGTTLLLKTVQDPAAAANFKFKTPSNAANTKAASQAGAGPSSNKDRKVRFALPEDPDYDDDEEEDDEALELQPLNTAAAPSTTTTTVKPANSTPITNGAAKTDASCMCCSNCGTIEASGWEKDASSGAIECIFCFRYRAKKGQARPAAVYKRSSTWKPAGGIQTVSAAAPATANSNKEKPRPTGGAAPTTAATPKPILKRSTTPATAGRTNNNNPLVTTTPAGTATANAVKPGSRNKRRGEKRKRRRGGRVLGYDQARKIALIEALKRKRLKVSDGVQQARLELKGILDTSSVSAGVSQSVIHLGGKLQGIAPITPNSNTTPVAEVVPEVVATLDVPEASALATAAAAKVPSFPSAEEEHLKQQVAELRQRVIEVEQGKAAAEHQFTEEHQRQRVDCDKQLAELKSQLEASENNALQSKAALVELQSYTDKVVEQFGVLSEERQNLVTEITAILHHAVQAVQDFERSMATAKQEEMRLNRQIDVLEVENKQLTKSVVFERSLRIDKESMLAAVVQEHQTVCEEYQGLIDSKESEKQAMKAQIEDLERNISIERESKLIVEQKLAENVVQVQQYEEALKQEKATRAAVEAHFAAFSTQHAHQIEVAAAHISSLQAQLNVLLEKQQRQQAREQEVENGNKDEEPIVEQEVKSQHQTQQEVPQLEELQQQDEAAAALVEENNKSLAVVVPYSSDKLPENPPLGSPSVGNQPINPSKEPIALNKEEEKQEEQAAADGQPQLGGGGGDSNTNNNDDDEECSVPDARGFFTLFATQRTAPDDAGGDVDAQLLDTVVDHVVVGENRLGGEGQSPPSTGTKNDSPPEVLTSEKNNNKTNNNAVNSNPVHDDYKDGVGQVSLNSVQQNIMMGTPQPPTVTKGLAAAADANGTPMVLIGCFDKENGVSREQSPHQDDKVLDNDGAEEQNILLLGDEKGAPGSRARKRLHSESALKAGNANVSLLQQQDQEEPAGPVSEKKQRVETSGVAEAMAAALAVAEALGGNDE